MRFNNKTEEAAKAFFNKIAPQVQWDYTDHKAKNLVLSAFHLYAADWSGSGRRWDIRKWEWPFTALKVERGFEGDQPWTVLFRRAVELCS